MLRNRRRKYRDASRVTTMATPRFNECNSADDETLKIRTLEVKRRGRRDTAGIPSPCTVCICFSTHHLYMRTIFRTCRDIFQAVFHIYQT